MTLNQANESLAHIITAIILLDEVDWDGMIDAINTQHEFSTIIGRGLTELAYLQDLVDAAHTFQQTATDLELAHMQAGPS